MTLSGQEMVVGIIAQITQASQSSRTCWGGRRWGWCSAVSAGKQVVVIGVARKRGKHSIGNEAANLDFTTRTRFYTIED